MTRAISICSWQTAGAGSPLELFVSIGTVDACHYHDFAVGIFKGGEKKESVQKFTELVHVF